MSDAAFIHTELPFFSMLARLGLAALLGLVIGIDREYRARPAGLRTHMLVALASATFVIVAFEILALVGDDANAEGDPIRAIEAITAGVAFLAAGTIIQGRRGVDGITTGAGMWLAGAIGLASGVGLYTLAIAGTVLGLVILSVLQAVERRLPKGRDREPPPPADGRPDGE